jgi:4-hydroxybenzoate polyprenyltransferase
MNIVNKIYTSTVLSLCVLTLSGIMVHEYYQGYFYRSLIVLIGMLIFVGGMLMEFWGVDRLEDKTGKLFHNILLFVGGILVIVVGGVILLQGLARWD